MPSVHIVLVTISVFFYFSFFNLPKTNVCTAKRAIGCRCPVLKNTSCMSLGGSLVRFVDSYDTAYVERNF